MKIVTAAILSLACGIIHGQGYNHQWLLGNYNFPQDPKGRMFIDSNNYNIITEFRKMPFYGTQGNICDANGNFLMSSNGIWIANANNDTMMNGSGLNPGPFASGWPYGFPLSSGNLFIPKPGNISNYFLIHQTGSPNQDIPSLEIFSSEIDINLDSGLGEVIAKNIIILQDSLAWGIGACKHANGRDWWIVAMKDSSNIIYKILIDNAGASSVTAQSLNFLPIANKTVVQHTFSPDGSKFISATYDDPVNRNSFIIIADFDRCTGMFSNTQTVQLTSGWYLWGLAFSPSGNFAYACSDYHIFQVDVNTLAVDTVAVYDGFISPGPSCCPATFWNMYLAANGKIYVTSGSGIRHFTEINYPDSAGLACDVQQHAVFIGNYAHLRAVPSHPNYYLGCDTTLGCPCLTTDIQSLSPPDFKFRLYPNPVTNGFLNIGYLLPQNKHGVFEIFDVTGKAVFKYTLPHWSNEQSFKLAGLHSGIYNCVITSDNKRISKKLAVINE